MSIKDYISGPGIKGQRWGIIPTGEIKDPELLKQLKLLKELDDRDYIEVVSDDKIALIKTKG